MYKVKRQQAGFTLAETLLTILIMLMVSSIVAVGIPAARTAYEKVVLASNAQVLLSTTVATLRSELSNALQVAVIDDAVTSVDPGVYYYHTGIQARARLYVDTDNNIMITRFNDYTSAVDVALIQTNQATAGMYVTYEDVEADNDENPTVVEFKNIEVWHSINTSSPLASLDVLAIRPISMLPVNEYLTIWK